MKLGQKICPNDILDEFENRNLCFKNMAAKGQGIFPYMAKYGYCKILLTL
jgi:hypothetical protein